MKLNGKAMVAVMMMLGSLNAIGCKQPDAQGNKPDSAGTTQPATATQPAATPVAKSEEAPTITARTTVAVKTQIPAPPPRRFESPGTAPSREHAWMKGFWRWNDGSVRYEWIPGHWMIQFAPSAPPAPRYEEPGRPPSERHAWVKGYWKWTGREWSWIGGHWDTIRGGHIYIAPHWDKENGRWHYAPGRWVRR